MHLISQFVAFVLWACFLVLFLVITLIQDIYPSLRWEYVSLALYLVLTLECLRYSIVPSRAAIIPKQARPVFALMILVVVLLMVQTYLPRENSVLLILKQHFVDKPLNSESWLSSREVISVVPELTWNLIRSELLVLSAFFGVLLFVRSRARLKTFIYFLLSVSLLHIAIGLGAHLGNVHIVDIRELDGHYTAARGLFINRNHFAAFLVMSSVAPITLIVRHYFASMRLSGIRYLLSSLLSAQVLVYLCFFLLLVALLSSESRAGYLALLLSVVVVVFVFGRNIKSTISLFVVILGFVFGATLMFGDVVLERLLSSDNLLGERWLQWQLTEQIIALRPWFGFGGNSYAEVFQAYRGNADLRELIYNQAHNHYLHLWLEQGLIGLAAWLSICFLALFRAVKTALKTHSKLSQAVLFACTVVVLSALLQSIVDFNLQIISIRFTFFAILALIFATDFIQRSNTGRSSK